jgi:aryl-alcohol dehydrogenase-like predicted oxidoreductase
MLRDLTRRELLQRGASLGVAAAMPFERLFAQTAPLILRAIPSSGEKVPAVGIGTARRYDVAPGAPERAEIKEVLKLFSDLGGKVIDTAPSYGQAEAVVGEATSALGNRSKLFVATKLGANGRAAAEAQVAQSFARLKTDKIDLIAVHNLTDVRNQLAYLRELKQAGRIRYVGVTTSSDNQYAALEEVMKVEMLDVIQVDYAIDNRGVADRILPLAKDRGMGVMINLPFGRGRVFQEVQGKALPAWASEFDCKTWAQFFLKYIVANPVVTCVVPGTAQVKYVADNLAGAQGRLPDAAMLKKMEAFVGV